jgi:hypothetical protein
MTAHSAPISSRFIAGIAFGIVVFPAGRRAVYRVVLVQIKSRPQRASKWGRFTPPPAPHSRRRAYFYL